MRIKNIKPKTSMIVHVSADDCLTNGVDGGAQYSVQENYNKIQSANKIICMHNESDR